jgi:hypothetical protein
MTTLLGLRTEAPVLRPPIARVVLWMIGALLSFSAMAVSIRELSATLGIMEILSARAAIGLLIVCALLAIRPGLPGTLNRRRLRLHVLRNSIHFGVQYLWATSLLLLPLSTVFALEFTMPAWTMLLATLFLDERMTPSRIGVVANLRLSRAPGPADVHTLVTISELHREVARFGQPLLHDWVNDFETTTQTGPRDAGCVGRVLDFDGDAADGAAGLSGFPISEFSSPQSGLSSARRPAFRVRSRDQRSGAVRPGQAPG